MFILILVVCPITMHEMKYTLFNLQETSFQISIINHIYKRTQQIECNLKSQFSILQS